MSANHATPASPGYYGNVNPTLLNAVNPGAQRICEFGCGAGALARAIRQRQPGVHYIGVEIAADQLALAADVLDVSLVRNLDFMPDWSADSEFAALVPESNFDHVIFGDVLEHLYDPWSALAQASRRLVPGGSALVCIPNVQHWSVFQQLMLGSWPQSDSGLFDRTHVRWFALTDMVQLLQGAGLVVERIIPRVFTPEKGQLVTQHLRSLSAALGLDHAEFVRRSLPIQYVLEGRKR